MNDFLISYCAEPCKQKPLRSGQPTRRLLDLIRLEIRAKLALCSSVGFLDAALGRCLYEEVVKRPYPSVQLLEETKY